MAAVTYVCSIDYVAKMLGEDAELLEAITYNDDNLTYGNIVSVYVGLDEIITALTDDGIEELREWPIAALRSGTQFSGSGRRSRSSISVHTIQVCEWPPHGSRLAGL
jgi:hypothetical protein